MGLTFSTRFRDESATVHKTFKFSKNSFLEVCFLVFIMNNFPKQKTGGFLDPISNLNGNFDGFQT